MQNILYQKDIILVAVVKVLICYSGRSTIVVPKLDLKINNFHFIPGQFLVQPH